MVPKIKHLIKPLWDPIRSPDAPKVPKMENQIDTVLKPFYAKMSRDIMPFDMEPTGESKLTDVLWRL